MARQNNGRHFLCGARTLTQRVVMPNEARKHDSNIKLHVCQSTIPVSPGLTTFIDIVSGDLVLLWACGVRAPCVQQEQQID
jgi:hypothetical protein